MAAKTTNALHLTEKSQKLIVDYVDQAYQVSKRSLNQDYMEWIDRQYARKWDLTNTTLKAKLLSALGDPTKFQNLIYPIIMPQIESAVAYQAEYFCSGVPIFPVVTVPRYAEAGSMLEAILDRDAQRGAWATEFTKSFRDAFKYNRAGTSCIWKQVVSAVEGSRGREEASVKPIFQGNSVKRVDMYNAIIDPRVPLAEVSTLGEFAGETTTMPLTALRAFVMGLPQKYMQNFNAALTSAKDTTRYYRPRIGESLFAKSASAPFDWNTYLGIQSPVNNGKNAVDIGTSYDVTTIAMRIRPSDFAMSNISAPNTPQVFLAILINWQHLISFQQLTTEHDMLPYLFYRAYEDGLENQTPSMAENLESFQNLATGKVNGMIAGMRRMLSDRAIYNPMYIDGKDINNDSPTAKIAMKPSAILAADASKAYFPIPYNPNTEALSLTQMEMIENMSYKCSGQNPARQGQFVKGNKTREEYNSIMDNSTSGDRMVSIHLESRLFAPLKSQLRYNTIRYQGADVIFNRKDKQAIEIRPQEMVDAILEFQIGDGMTPSSKLANTEVLVSGLQTIMATPQLSQQYAIGDIFASIMQAGGVTVGDYKFTPEQIQYNQALAAWQQAAAEAAKTGAAFSTPMPQAPGSQQQSQG